MGTAAVLVLWVLQMGTAGTASTVDASGYCTVPVGTVDASGYCTVPVSSAGYCGYCGYCDSWVLWVLQVGTAGYCRTYRMLGL